MDNKLKIVNYLGKHAGQAFTMHELSNAASIPYATLYRSLLKIKGLILIRAVGKAKVVSINQANPLIKPYLIISSAEEKEEFLRNQPILSKIAFELDTRDIVLLFGSYAKGNATDKSDIDILIINSQGKKSVSFNKYETLFGKKINPMYVAKSEFALMLKDKEENVGKQALKSHIILNNPEGFWERVLHGKLQRNF
jgi:predicted nucleotidyltransferase